MKRSAFILLLLAMTMIAFGQTDPTFEAGLTAYRAGEWEKAAAAWENALRSGSASGALFYNLGNAYYRMQQTGRSILWYERARQLLPRDGDVRGNLELARLAVVDRIEPPVRLMIWDWVDAIRDYFSLRELALLLQLAGAVALLAFLLWRFGPAALTRAARNLVIICLILLVVTGAWYGWRAVLDGRAQGIVMDEKADVFSAPDAASTQVFTLHEGTKVRIGERLSGWVNIRLADGRQGWVLNHSVERI